jgi:hypothetical protein
MDANLINLSRTFRTSFHLNPVLRGIIVDNASTTSSLSSYRTFIGFGISILHECIFGDGLLGCQDTFERPPSLPSQDRAAMLGRTRRMPPPPIDLPHTSPSPAAAVIVTRQSPCDAAVAGLFLYPGLENNTGVHPALFAACAVG